MKQLINPPSLVKPRGFNHGIWCPVGSFSFSRGKRPATRTATLSPAIWWRSIEQVLLNHKAVVEAAGGVMTNIVKLNVFVRDKDNYLANLKPLGAVHRKYFGTYYPTMALFEIKSLFQEAALIEMEGMAVIGADGVT